MNQLTSKHKILFKDLGLIDYKEAWDYQEKLHRELVSEKEEIKKRNSGQSFPEKQVVLLCEHPHVYTLGRSGKENNLLINSEFLKKIGADYYRINRGGDITYHGPGQIVGYPILDLEAMKIRIKDYVWMIEESIISLLEEYSIKAGRLDGATGVWLDTDIPGKTRKICAIGVRVSSYVTMHGFALNVNTDLNYFKYINPCGFADKEVTSMSRETGRKEDLEKAKKGLTEKIAGILNIDLELKG